LGHFNALQLQADSPYYLPISNYYPLENPDELSEQFKRRPLKYKRPQQCHGPRRRYKKKLLKASAKFLPDDEMTEHFGCDKRSPVCTLPVNTWLCMLPFFT
jgi:hypothetical protein